MEGTLCLQILSNFHVLIIWITVLLNFPLHCFGVLNASVTNQQEMKLGELPPPPKPDYNQCRLLRDIDKLDCFPENGSSVTECEIRGCCWMPHEVKSERKVDVPHCFYPPNYQSYSYINITETIHGLTAFLKRNFKSAYSDDVVVLKMTVNYESETRLHIKFTDPNHIRFESHYPKVPVVDTNAVNNFYKLELNQANLGFRIIRKFDNTIVFDTFNYGNFIFSNQFLQLSAKLPSSNIYGLGERNSHLMLSTQWQRFALFNYDGIPSEALNLYGTHPFYLVMESSGNSHGVFLLNSNAMDVILQPAPAITFRPIGGVFDFYFFLGPSPSDVIKQYTEIIGKPYMPPYWSLGFHLCRYGYLTLNDTRNVMQRNIDAGIPIDTQWNDLDYMDNNHDFTYDNKRYNGLPEFVKELHEKGMHYIPIIDPGISANDTPGTYFPYDKGIEMDVFLKNSTGQLFIGKVWNHASTVWPDFTHPNCTDYWTLLLTSLHKLFEFDGAWLDLNEPTNFLSGSFDGCPKSPLENPPYLPAVEGGLLYYRTICMTAQHFAGLHYDMHNLYGLIEAIVTNAALAKIRGKRPVVISRATFPGVGHYAGHWTGDVNSKWHDMKFSIPQLLSFSMFGVPLTGADICGFNGNTTVSLCNRWVQLGAFYPFARNHNTDDGIEQDPVAMGPLVVNSAKKALDVRYSLLPYLYTLFWAAHVHGETVARPVFFEFTNDTRTYAIDEQFMWGAAVMILPVLEENSVTVSPYIPSGIWYDFYSKSALESKGESFNISAPLDTIPILVRGGYIIPQQSVSPTTTQSRLSKIQLLAASDASQQGSGQLYWDDGDSLSSVEELKYSLLQFTLKANELSSEPIWWGFEETPQLGMVTILGITTLVNEVTVNQKVHLFYYDSNNKYLLINNLNISLKSSILIKWK